MEYRVYNTDNWQSYAVEQMGSKRKMWLQAPNGDRHLFKYPRPGFGEAWAEKAASEIATLLGVPHAEVELATFQGQQGTICRSFVEEPGGNLYHGNQLLEIVVPGYDKEKHFGQSEHTYGRVIGILEALEAAAPAEVPGCDRAESGVACFAGYVVLDALISNTDRHHENWAVILSFRHNEDGSAVIDEVKLAPTFDHASSLGRELSDEKRALLLADEKSIERYRARCPSRLYWNETDSKPKHPVELVRLAAGQSPHLFRSWLERVDGMNEAEISAVFSRFPPGWMTPTAISFAIVLVRTSQNMLRDAHRSLPQ